MSASASRIARRQQRRGASLRQAVAALPDVILPDDYQGELGEPRRVVAEVESRTIRAGRFADGGRSRAKELHREADQLYFKGDYESALVLYRRAARLCPRDSQHAVAARRAEAAIHTAAEPPREIGRMLRGTRTPSQMSAVLCPEAAARRARAIVQQSQDPVQEIPRILKFFDSRKDFWRLSSPQSSPRASRSKLMLRQLNKCVRSTFRDLESAHEAGDAAAVHRLSDELVNLVSLTAEPERNQVDAYRYLAAKHTALGRHDRAIEMASRMLFVARTCGDVLAMVDAMVTIGRVHLEFGHVDALVKVWERLVSEVESDAIPEAWLRHEIGRCYLQLGDFSRGLQSARRCASRAEEARSSKWLIRGQLLAGQCLLKLGRLAEAVTALKLAARVAQDVGEEESQILGYVQALIDQVTSLLRRLNERRMRGGRGQPVRIDADEDKSTFSLGEALAEAFGHVKQESHRDDHTAADPAASDTKSTTEPDRIGQLLERTRALRREQSSLDKPGKLPAPPQTVHLSVERNEEQEDDLVLDSSRTRIIRREAPDSEDERTLKPGELMPLSDVSCVEEDFASARLEELEQSGEETARSEVDSPAAAHAANEASLAAEEKASCNDDSEPPSYLSDKDEQELTSRSLGFNMQEDDMDSDSPDAPMKQTSAKSLSEYLKSLETGDFEEFVKQERDFFEMRTSGD